ncbi:hypothetical protein ACFVX6_17505 [Streptomyces sp. NPDC058289]|uniref:hypothetical protein n=1 Tax=Streptomyces sp. NPDC058289 TaxID=3346425 RepID=UPI0036EFBF39
MSIARRSDQGASRRLAGAASVAALAAVLAGCGAPTTDSMAGSATAADPGRIAIGDLPVAPTRGLAKGLTLPLDGYTVTAAEGYVWQSSVQQQWRSCMARYGFKDFGPPAVSERSVADSVNTAVGRRYGISDIDLARTYGYHLPNDAPEPPRWEPAAGGESAVFTGTGVEVEGGTYKGKEIPDGGCRGETKRLFPLPQTPEANAISGRIFEDSRDDAKVVGAAGKWVSCMKTKGYDRKHPLDDLDELGIEVSSPAATTGEIAQAVADVECKQQTNLVAVWNAQERELQESAINSNTEKLAAEVAVKNRETEKVRQAYQTAGNR